MLKQELKVLQKASNRQKSRIRARTCLRASTHRQIEHVFGYLSQSMQGFYLSACDAQAGLRYVGRRRNAAAIGLTRLLRGGQANLIYNLARYESRFRIGT